MNSMIDGMSDLGKGIAGGLVAREATVAPASKIVLGTFPIWNSLVSLTTIRGRLLGAQSLETDRPPVSLKNCPRAIR